MVAARSFYEEFVLKSSLDWRALVVAWLAFGVLQLAPHASAAPPTTRPEQGLREKTPATYALTEARIVVSPDKTIEHGTVVVRDGVITDVGADVAPPEGARVMSLSGKTIYPGLIDAYSEVRLDAGAGGAGADYWNSNVRPAQRVADQFRADTALNKKLRAQGITARLVAPAAGIIKGSSALVSTSDAEPARSLLVADVAQHIRLTVSRGGGRDSYPNSPMGAVALARQAFYDAQWYGQAWKGYRADPTLPRPEANAALEVLQKVMENDQLVIIDAQNELYALRAGRFADEFTLNFALRGSGNEYRRLDAIRALGRTVILPVNFPKPPNVATAEAAINVPLESLMHWDLAPENPGRLDRAGVSIALTSHGLSDQKDFLAGVRRAVHRGLTPDAALRALTITPAQLVGAAQLGSVEPGKLAYFVVTDGPLFEDKTKILETWIDGERFELEKKPSDDLRGTWELTFSDPAEKPATLFAILSGRVEKLTGTLDEQAPGAADEQAEGGKSAETSSGEEPAAEAQEASDKPDASANQDEKTTAVTKAEKGEDARGSLKLEHVDFRAGRLTATFQAKRFGAEGVARITAVVTSPDGQILWNGYVVWPDGGRTDFDAKRIADHKEEATKSEGDDAAEGAKSEDADAAEQDNQDSKQDTAAARDETAEAAEDDPAEEVAAGEEEVEENEESDEGEKNAEARKDKPASFSVNFPLGAFGREAPPTAPEHVLFKNGTIWTCGPEGLLENTSVLVTGGKIAAVGEDIQAPENAVVIDLKGRHLTPGIIDCHSHMATDGGINESAQAITAEVRIGDFIDPDDIDIYRQLAGGVTTANVLHGSANPIGGQNQVIKLRWSQLPEELKFKSAPAGIKFALGENVKQSNWGSEYSTRYPQSRMGVEQIVRDAFYAAREYHRRRQEWQKTQEGLPPRRDLELDALAEVLEGNRWIHCHSYRQDEILAFLRTLESFEVQVGTLQHILEGYKVADAMASHGAMGSSFSDWWAYKFEVYDAIPYNGALMHNAGVVVSFNSDDQELARHLNHEAAKAVKYGGVPPEEALKFVTLNPAKQLRIDQYVGSIEVGKQADLVVWSGQPLSIMSRCEQTWIDGAMFFDVEEDRQMRKQADEMRNTLVQKILTSGEAMREPGDSDVSEAELWPREDIFCHSHDHHAHQ